MRKFHFLSILFSLSIILSLNIYSQTKAQKPILTNVFIDCRFCDMKFVYEKIDFVNFVRDRNDADVHILFTRQHTGGNGRMITLNFIGLKKFKGILDTLKYSTNVTDTEDTERIKLVNTLKLGLVHFISKTPIAKDLVISYKNPELRNKEELSDNDWDFWVYRINLNTYFNGEKSYSSFSGWSTISANRITKESKFYSSVGLDYDESNFDYDNEKIKNVSRNYRARLSYIGAITKHWSWGVWTNYFSSTYSNQKNSFSGAPGIEYNFFPYSESTRKQFRIDYKILPKYNQYFEETIYFKKSEFLVEQSLSVNLEIIQPWGNIDFTLRGSNFLHDFSKRSIEFYGDFEIRVLKGLNFNLYLGVQAIHNQLTLPRSNAEIDDVLLRQRELETNFNYWGSLGFSYTIGSIFSNIVNPRFGD